MYRCPTAPVAPKIATFRIFDIAYFYLRPFHFIYFLYKKLNGLN